jgi:hypothetical protein
MDLFTVLVRPLHTIWPIPVILSYIPLLFPFLLPALAILTCLAEYTLLSAPMATPLHIIPLLINSFTLSFAITQLLELYGPWPYSPPPPPGPHTTVPVSDDPPVLPEIALPDPSESEDEDVWRAWPPRLSGIDLVHFGAAQELQQRTKRGERETAVNWDTVIRDDVHARWPEKELDNVELGNVTEREVARLVKEMRRQSRAMRMSAILREEFGNGQEAGTRDSWWIGLRGVVFGNEAGPS